MKTNNYVIINDRAYDPVTGLAVEDAVIDQPQETPDAPTSGIAEAQAQTRGVAVPHVHQTVQGSATLNRRHLARPHTTAKEEAQTETQPIVAAYSPVSLPKDPVKKSPSIEKFPVTVRTAKKAPGHVDKPAQTHPVAHRAAGASIDITAPQRQRHVAVKKQAARSERITASAPTVVAAAPAPSSPKPARVLKNEAIYEAMHKEVVEHKRTRAKKQRSAGRLARFTTIASASLAVVLLAGYFTYLSMPNLSLKMAATQSGISATYPNYSPDGYRLSGPVAFKDGEVSMRFAYAGGEQDFTLTQRKSNWNSSAVREYVAAKNNNATTTQVDGLTIYTYEGNAAWVNGGILYVLEGNAPLSSDQIQRIATSM